MIVFFDFDSASISESEQSTITDAVRAFRETGAATLALSGHTDKSGASAYNAALSKKRVDAVAEAYRQVLAQLSSADWSAVRDELERFEATTLSASESTCPATTVYAAYNAIPGDTKELVVYPNMGHAVPQDWGQRVNALIEASLIGP